MHHLHLLEVLLVELQEVEVVHWISCLVEEEEVVVVLHCLLQEGEVVVHLVMVQVEVPLLLVVEQEDRYLHLLNETS